MRGYIVELTGGRRADFKLFHTISQARDYALTMRALRGGSFRIIECSGINSPIPYALTDKGARSV